MQKVAHRVLTLRVSSPFLRDLNRSALRLCLARHLVSVVPVTAADRSRPAALPVKSGNHGAGKPLA
jgi:hypothetical protein